jgi:trehalose utilization protein
VYPHDVDGALGDDLRRRKNLEVALARLDQPEAGLAGAALDATDVLIWWGRLRHDDLPEARSRAVVDRVRAGRLGFLALHSACVSKPFKMLMGTSCEPGGWSDDGRAERIEIKAPNHPIANGIAPFTIPRTAMYTEPFAVPNPETVVLVSSFDTGETFRSGLTWTIGQGRVVYFRPGNDAFPVLFHPSVRQVIANAAFWAGKRPLA